MTSVVLEVGPVEIRGPGCVDPDVVSAAIDAVDDGLTLLNGRAVPTVSVWQNLLRTAAGADADDVTIVVPASWAAARRDLIADAAQTIGTEVRVVSRARAFDTDRGGAVVEFGPEFLAVTHVVGTTLVPRHLGDPTVRVATLVDAADEVTVDVPPGVHPGELATVLTKRLGSRGTVVRQGDPVQAIRQPAPLVSAVSVPPGVDGGHRTAFGKRMPAVLAGVAVCGATVGLGVAPDDTPARPVVEDSPSTLLTEGRIGVQVPALWNVRRVTSGPGSARLQVVSTSDPAVGLHVTQSALPPGQTFDSAAAAVRAALDEQPPGVFTEFNPADRIAGRPVVSYRETRGDRDIRWALLIVDSVRIAIGCQAPADRSDLVRPACDAAIRSAHVVF